MDLTQVIIQQLIVGLSNGLIVALIALGYSMVFGIIELINFAHGDLFMLGSFLALTIVGVTLSGGEMSTQQLIITLVALFLCVPLSCGMLNVFIERYAYRPLRKADKLAPLVAAIGVSFILVNIGLFWGGLPLDVFNGGSSASAPKDFPALLGFDNLLGDSSVYLSFREVFVAGVTVPILLALSYLVRRTKLGIAMRATAQNPEAAGLMGVDVNKIISVTFFIGGVLAGVASIVFCIYNSTVSYQMGFRAGVDAFTAAVLGGIGSFMGAFFGGLLIGIIRALSDQFISTSWTNAVVFAVLILVLVFRPQGLLGRPHREKV